MNLKCLSILAGCVLAVGCADTSFTSDDPGDDDAEDVDSTEEAMGLRAPPPQLVLLEVDEVEPALPIEGRPIYLHFTLTNSTTKTLPRFGTLWADFQSTGPFVSSGHTSVWTLEKAVPPGGSMHGVLELTLPFAAPLTVTPHYSDVAFTAPFKESNATEETLPVAIRSSFAMSWVYVNHAADQFLGDHDTASIGAVRNGSTTFFQTTGMGFMHGGSFHVDVETPAVNLVPGSGDTMTYTTRVDRTPYSWFGGPVQTMTMGTQSFTFSADTVRATVSDATFGSGISNTWLDNRMCDGIWSTGLNTPCPSGQADYTLLSNLYRHLPSWDTVPLSTHVTQIRSDQSVDLAPNDASSPSYEILSGGGSVGSHTYYPAPVSDITLVTIVVHDGARTTTLYVEVRPASWG